jgi:hypothetical protein
MELKPSMIVGENRNESIVTGTLISKSFVADAMNTDKLRSNSNLFIILTAISWLGCFLHG